MRARTLGGTYLAVAVSLAAFVALLTAVALAAPAPVVKDAARALIQPVVALVVLTAIVAVVMIVFRNVAVMRGTASVRYFRAFTVEAPAERIERPARAYMNLLELPVLFYVVCLLMLTTGRFDSVQVSLAWLFVATRYLHAFIYIGFNDVAFRFAAFLAGFLTLAVIWTRFAAQNLVW